MGRKVPYSTKEVKKKRKQGTRRNDRRSAGERIRFPLIRAPHAGLRSEEFTLLRVNFPDEAELYPIEEKKAKVLHLCDPFTPVAPEHDRS
jgi:hypothetical protein